MSFVLPMIVAFRGYIESLLSDREEGQGMVEYVLIIGAISVALVVAFNTGGVSTAITALSGGVASAIQATVGSL